MAAPIGSRSDVAIASAHQVRRHLAGINHPVVGDQNHGDNDHNHLFWHQLKIPGLLLMARKLSFVHPIYDKQVEVVAEMGQAMSKAFALLGFEMP